MIIVILIIIMILLKTITVLGFRSSLSSLSSRSLLSRSSLLSSSTLLNRKYNKFKKIKSNINDNITGTAISNTKNINDNDNDDSIITTRVPKKFVPVPFVYHQVLDIVIDDITNLGLGVGRY